MIDATVYKNVLGSFPSGVTVITTLDDDGSIAGLTASAFRPCPCPWTRRWQLFCSQATARSSRLRAGPLLANATIIERAVA